MALFYKRHLLISKVDGDFLRKLDLEKTSQNIDIAINNNTIYSYYALTENNDYVKNDESFVKEWYRFTCEGNKENKDAMVNLFIDIMNKIQVAYVKAINIKNDVFKIVSVKSTLTAYNTIAIDISVEGLVGAFRTAIDSIGIDAHQFHASDIWVRANEKATAWKSLYRYDEKRTKRSHVRPDWLDMNTTSSYLVKVGDATYLVNNCIKESGEPDEETKLKLKEIMES